MIFLVFILLLSGIAILILGRSAGSLWYMGIVTGMTLLIVGFMFYFSKIGGITSQLSAMFVPGTAVRGFLYNMPIGANRLSLLTVWGRVVVFFCFAGFCIHESPLVPRKKKRWACFGAGVVAALLLLTFLPSVYESLSRRMTYRQLELLDAFWRVVIITALVFMAGLLVGGVMAEKFRWLRRRMAFVCISLLELMFFYVMIGVLTPLQLSRLDRTSFVLSRYFYYEGAAVRYWDPIITGSILFTIVSAVFLLAAIRMERTLGKPDVRLERKMLAGNLGVRVFAHGIKNQLLVNRVLIDELRVLAEALMENDSPKDTNLTPLLRDLRENNDGILQRLNELNDFFRQKKIVLTRMTPAELLEPLVQKFSDPRYRRSVAFDVRDPGEILADASLMRQTIGNIITNALEAVLAKREPGRAENEKGRVTVTVQESRDKSVIEVRDNGIGIPRGELNKIFAPFYTSKNTRNNWGIGLSCAQKILKEHDGMLRVESREGEGTSIYLILPRYEGGR